MATAAVSRPSIEAIGKNVHAKTLPHYEQVAVTTHDLDWADLVTLDLSLFDSPGGKDKLAKQLFDAVQNIGFFYVINFGLSQEEVDRQFAIGKEFFDLPMTEKLQFRADLENGGYNGYKPLGLRVSSPEIVKPRLTLTSRKSNPVSRITLRYTTSQNSFPRLNGLTPTSSRPITKKSSISVALSTKRWFAVC